jgi:hypothetical protein
MKLLDQFIAQTGKQPSNWTSQDIQGYLNYVSAQVTEGTGSKRYERLPRKPDIRHPFESLRAGSEKSEGSLGPLEIRNYSPRSE